MQPADDMEFGGAFANALLRALVNFIEGIGVGPGSTGIASEGAHAFELAHAADGLDLRPRLPAGSDDSGGTGVRASHVLGGDAGGRAGVRFGHRCGMRARRLGNAQAPRRSYARCGMVRRIVRAGHGHAWGERLDH